MSAVALISAQYSRTNPNSNSGVPNQPAGTFRAFLIIALNIVEVIILFLAETGFPASFFKNWIPCLDNEHSLVGLGVLEVLLAAQMMSHFMEYVSLHLLDRMADLT